MSLLEKDLHSNNSCVTTLNCFKKSEGFKPNNITVKDILVQELEELKNNKDAKSQSRKFEIMRIIDDLK